jgi:hypothetical protein
MQHYEVELPFSIGTPQVEVELSGQYAKLDSQSDDTLRAATVASLLQLPHWLQSQTDSRTSDQGNQPSSHHASGSTANHGTATCKIDNNNGQIQVRLNVKNAREIPEQFIKMVTNAIAASVQNHADSALIGTPATNDAFVQIQRYLATRQTDQSQHSAVGAGNGGNQR